MGKLWVGIFLLAIGVSWFGNDIGWWKMNLPWVPLVVVLVGAGMLVKWAMMRERD